MYAVYTYKAGSVLSQVLADIVAILTGATDVTTLSASCNQANSSIVATTAAGWLVHDSAAGVNQQVVKALNADGSTYKYMLLNALSINSIAVTGYESWNASTHVGTNSAGSSGTFNWDAATGGVLYVYSTARNALFMSHAAVSYSAPVGVLEFTRDTVTASTNYPTLAILNGSSFGQQGGSNAGISRFKSYGGVGDTLSSAVLLNPVTGQVGAGGGAFQGAHVYRDASENMYLCTYPVGLTLWISTYAMWVGKCYDIRAAGVGGFSTLDEIVYNGQNYVVWQQMSATMLIPKA